MTVKEKYKIHRLLWRAAVKEQNSSVTNKINN